MIIRLQDIGARLLREFPDQYTSFDIVVDVHPNSNPAITLKIRLYVYGVGFFNINPSSDDTFADDAFARAHAAFGEKDYASKLILVDAGNLESETTNDD
ncbi:MAG: hypothetical protein AMJ84_13340 [Acidithiobacillales bacterium SM23_46]|nr:MAG: hypothetical protein AMJ84_13340 [Acidithiobacillales bacterium SM23_46]